MELIRLLINSVNSRMCFLCFKESDDTQNISSRLEIKNQYFNGTLSLVDIVNTLFPSFDLTLSQACLNCTDLFIRMYLSLQRNNIMKNIIKTIIDIFDKEISINTLVNLNSLDKIAININLSKIINIGHQNLPLQTHNNDHRLNNENKLYEDKTVNALVEQDVETEKQCSNCFKIFTNNKQYKCHIKNHNRKRKKNYHLCTYCEYKSLCKESLHGHMNKEHLNSKPFFCKICYKSFFHKKNLVEHETCHKQERNEICELCGETFIHKKNLLEHLKLHSGEKPYECEICGKRFVTSGRRLEHIKRSHSEKKECCLLCDKKFSLNKELTRHLKTVHS